MNVYAGLEVCSCVSCELDFKAGEPMSVAQWRGDGHYWAPFGSHIGHGGNGFYRNRKHAHAFGPRHVRELSSNFIVTPIRKGRARNVRRRS